MGDWRIGPNERLQTREVRPAVITDRRCADWKRQSRPRSEKAFVNRSASTPTPTITLPCAGRDVMPLNFNLLSARHLTRPTAS
jgi:hypothetical protein